jgi:DNA-binding response OmpR family regulator
VNHKTGSSILVVDDDAVYQTLYAKLFSREGIEVMTASSLDESISLLDTCVPDLVLLDLVLGSENGFDLLHHIKSDNRYKNILVILITSSLTSSDEIVDGLERGADGYLTRPIEKKELLGRIKAFLRHKKKPGIHWKKAQMIFDL